MHDKKRALSIMSHNILKMVNGAWCVALLSRLIGYSVAQYYFVTK